MQKCDHTSVGLLVWRSGKLLLIERRRPPYGYAPPAGHVDDHGSFEDAAREELREEVGLKSAELRVVAEGRKDNKCRRPGGDWHYWKIYEAGVSGDVKASPDETKSTRWADRRALEQMADRTRQYLAGSVNQAEWERSPGLEPVWDGWLKELRIISQRP